ncbi:replication factor C subunit 3-like isoform X2 [Varroa jacobsoni]|uniref:AAA+ ATPase domain-containing protein n=1 Tax=Varroa destructor TaxID=109461 RepID=A0A7M7K2Y1_VARDE|nr:replication factor C subunit 3-like isoform X2 [Varroa destructor]XP_022689584.1 replication factor C subunit 3-like isoform X2 [Varroa jacobsoni]
MTLYVDKYRPRDLDSIDYHKKQAAWLKRLAQGGDLPHLLIYGPPGSGKKTRVMATLKELYGGGVDRLRIEQQVFTTQSKKKIELRTLSSNYHIEVNPSDVGNQDRVVIQELLKGIAQTHNVAVQAQQDKEERKKTFKVVILTEVERLSKEAQHALRRTMEKYMASCRLILMCNSTTKVIPAIRSRCLGLRVPAPTAHEIVGILQGISKRENLSLPEELAKRIAAESYGNLRFRSHLTKTSSYRIGKCTSEIRPTKSSKNKVLKSCSLSGNGSMNYYHILYLHSYSLRSWFSDCWRRPMIP